VNPQAYALLGLTAIVAVLVGVLVFAFMRFAAAARDTRQHLRESGGESAMLAIALQESVQKLRQQERAMAERAEASERLSTHIVNSITAGLLVVDPDGQVQTLNPAGRRMLGIREGVKQPTHYRDLLAGADPLEQAIAECLSTRQAIMRRALQMPEPIPARHLGVTVSPLGGAEPGAGGAICLFSDLTAVMELEEQLRLKETLARLGELTAGIAHEFRNGLATIHGYGRLIDPAALPSQFRPYIEGIRQETQALGQVVTNFLNFARPTQLSLATLDLGAVIARAADDIRHEMPGTGTLDVRGAFGLVEGDDVLLRQAFLNLLRNALEACVQAGIEPHIVVEGTIDRGLGQARVTVNDNGPGIREDQRDRIFQPFFTTKASGTGLGLALVQKIVVTHNGRVAAGVSPTGGACLQVTLPVSAASPVALPEVTK
jgi:signal transduction histidine kinase